jgi:hypothetical protein
VDGHNTKANTYIVLFKELPAVHSISVKNYATGKADVIQKFISNNSKKE